MLAQQRRDAYARQIRQLRRKAQEWRALGRPKSAGYADRAARHIRDTSRKLTAQGK